MRADLVAPPHQLSSWLGRWVRTESKPLRNLQKSKLAVPLGLPSLVPYFIGNRGLDLKNFP